MAAEHWGMGFNKRKMEDERRRAAEKEAAGQRATDALVEDAERLIAAWNERQAKRMPMLFSPTIGAVVKAGYCSCGYTVPHAEQSVRLIYARWTVIPMRP
jgi:hypothetical protein